ncbi:TraR/DksA family transcriptional regulator [Streptomyces sp. NPDC050418]|uniref:TraR/DksA family transcriptional regulator n=1 Tax=Streptomyces sp. NPDC050418 TaxID=3365612 RepID=UPI0037B5C84C
MVAKKTAVQHSATGRSAAAAKDVSGKKSTAAATSRTAKAVKSAAGGKKTAAAEEAGAAADAKKTVRTATKAAATKAATKEPSKEPSKSAGKAAAKKAPAAKKTAATKTAAKKVAAKKTAAKKTTAKKAPAKKAAADGAGSRPEGKAQSKPDSSEQAAKQTGAKSVGAKKAVKTVETAASAKGGGAVPKARTVPAAPGELAVRPGEDPWTEEEIAEVRTELQTEVERLRAEIAAGEAALAGLMRDSGDGAGDDQADTGTKNITREHEMALANNAREMLEQSERALVRLDAGTYGLCENCGNPIGKARVQAFPRATLCVECKQKQERRY